MKQVVKFLIPLIFTLSMCVGLAIYTAGTGKNDTYSIDNSDIQKTPPSQSDNNEKDSEVTQTATKNSKAEKYILKYNPGEDMVVLITQRKDGTQIISHIKSINPEYLEKPDIDALTKGIEFTSKEDMYILIEDYSS